MQDPFGLAQRKMGEEPQGHGGFDGKIRVPPLPTPPAAPAGRPGSDRFRGHPHRHIAASNESLIVAGQFTTRYSVLIRGMNLRLHPCSVTPAETRRAGRTAQTLDGLLAPVRSQLERAADQSRTLHRLLGWNPRTDRCRFHAGNPLPADVVVLDLALWDRLLAALGRGTLLVVLGDHQPVGERAAGSRAG